MKRVLLILFVLSAVNLWPPPPDDGDGKPVMRAKECGRTASLRVQGAEALGKGELGLEPQIVEPHTRQRLEDPCHIGVGITHPVTSA